MAAAVRFGVRPCRGAKQTEADNPVIDRNTVFAVVQESCPSGGIPQRGPGMGTDFKPVGIILPGTMGGTGKIAELDLMIRLIGIDSRVESNLPKSFKSSAILSHSRNAKTVNAPVASAGPN